MYKLTETKIKTEENVEYTTYGIKSENFCFNDLCDDKEKIEKLVSLCNENNLDECHINDVVQDFLVFIDTEF